MESQSEEYVAPLQPADSYNGARHENFTWSQSISDLDVIVNIPNCLNNRRDLKLEISSREIKIEARDCILRLNESQKKFKNDFEIRESPDEWTIIFQGQLSFSIKTNESIWILVPGEHVDIHLEKFKEKWWNALIVGEIKIDLDKIDRSRDLHELNEQEQMKIRELMWKQRKKIFTENN